MRRTRVWWPHHEVQILRRGDDRVWRIERRLEDQAVPHAERQQVLDRDRATRGHRLVERPVDPLQDLAFGQLRKEPVDGLIQCQPALFHKEHRRQRQDRLRHRRDAKDRVAPHRLFTTERHHADRVDVHVLTVRDKRDHTWEFTIRDSSGHGFV